MTDAPSIKVAVLFYTSGDDAPDEMIGIYADREAAEADIIFEAKKYGNGYDYPKYVKNFYIEEMVVNLNGRKIRWSK